MDNEIEIPLDILPDRYIALLEYCSEVTGDSTEVINNHVEQIVWVNLLNNAERLNG